MTVYLAGQVFGAAAANSFSGLTTRLDADSTPVNNSTVLVNSGLSLPLLANTVYRLDCVIIYDTNATANLQYSLALPASATFGVSHWGSGVAGNTSSSPIFHDYVSVLPLNAGGVASGTLMTLRTIFVVRTAGTAGNAVYQFAQSTASVVNTFLKKDSHIIAFQI